jgi:hypothetical protein
LLPIPIFKLAILSILDYPILQAAQIKIHNQPTEQQRPQTHQVLSRNGFPNIESFNKKIARLLDYSLIMSPNKLSNIQSNNPILSPLHENTKKNLNYYKPL